MSALIPPHHWDTINSIITEVQEDSRRQLIAFLPQSPANEPEVGLSLTEYEQGYSAYEEEARTALLSAKLEGSDNKTV
jgi:hypothetical protein